MNNTGALEIMRYFYANKFMKPNAVFILLLVLLNACTLKKRVYQRGYYADWSISPKSKHSKTLVYTPENAVTPSGEAMVGRQPEHYSEKQVLFTEAGRTGYTEFKVQGIQQDGDCGDVVTLRNGEVIKAKVLEVGEELIKYKRCDNLDGPVFSVSRVKVFSIRYANGSKDLFSKDEPQKESGVDVKGDEGKTSGEQASGDLKNKKTHPLAILSMVLAALGLLVVLSAIAAIWVSYKANKRIKEKPVEYRGSRLADIARLIAFIAIGLFILALLSFFIL